MARQSWLIIRVELVSGLGEEIHPSPGRDFLVSSDHSPLQFAVAIDTGFARWDLGHLHMFRLPGGAEYMLGGGEDGDETPSTELTRLGLLRLALGTEFEYVFDLGDEWLHRCEVRAVDVDPQAEFGDEPAAPGPALRVGSHPGPVRAIDPRRVTGAARSVLRRHVRRGDAAVDDERRAGHVAGVVAREEQRGLRELLGVPEPTHRDVDEPALFLLLV